MPDIVYVRGGDKTAPALCEKTGMKYGTRHDYKPYAPVYMIDIKWDDYDWQDYLSKVTRYRPTLAMAPDYEFPEQFDRLTTQINDLRHLNLPRIMVCPKFENAATQIPADCMIAVSVPTGYAGFLPALEELSGRRIHLLGGHPDQQLFLMQQYHAAGAEVVSLDGNVLGDKAMKGQYWRASGGWVDVRRQGESTEALAIRSALNIRAYFEANGKVFKSLRVTKCMYGRVLL